MRAGRQPEKSAAKADYVSKNYTSGKGGVAVDLSKLQNVKESPMAIEPNSSLNSPNN